jgi:hypothetical protein
MVFVGFLRKVGTKGMSRFVRGHRIMVATTEKIQGKRPRYRTISISSALTPKIGLSILWGPRTSLPSDPYRAARHVLRDLNARWHPLRDGVDLLLGDGVSTFYDAVRRWGIPPVGSGGGASTRENPGTGQGGWLNQASLRAPTPGGETSTRREKKRVGTTL